MILHDITVAGFRTFADPIHIGPFGERITIVHAPNGTGKTTLLDGFYSGLLESHAISGARAEGAMRAAGRNLSPEVTIVFSTGGVRYRLEKRFFKGDYAKLAREERGTFVAFAEGDAATEFVRGLLQAAAPGRGPVKADEHFGVGALLWAPQGHVAVPKLTTSVLAMARARLAGTAVTFGEHDAGLAHLVATWHGRFYTRTSQEATNAGSANLPALRKAVTDAEQRFERARDDVAALDVLRARFDDAANDRARFATLIVELGEEIASRKAAIDRYREVTAARAKAAAELEVANERWARADEAVRTVEVSRTAVAAAEKRTADRAEARDRATAVEAVARERLRAARAAIDKADADIESTELETSVAADATSFTDAVRDLAAAHEHARKSESLQREFDDLLARRTLLDAPAIADMKAIRKLVATVATAEAQFDAAILHLTFTPATAANVSVVLGETSSPAHVDAGTVFSISGSPRVAFSIDGVGSISAHGPRGSADDLRATLLAARRDLERRFRPFGTSDIVELERRHDATLELEKSIDRLDAILTGRRVDIGAVDELHSRVVELEARVASLGRRYPAWAERAPNAIALNELAAKRHLESKAARKSAAAALKVANAEAESRAADVRAAEIDCSSATSELAAARGTLQAREDDGLDDAARRGRRSVAGLAHVGATNAVELADLACAAFAVDPQAECTIFEQKLRGVKDAYEDASRTHAATEALLGAQMIRGLYDTLTESEATLHRARARADAEIREAAAAKLLYETFKSVEADREATVLEPLRLRTSELYNRVAGGATADVRFNRDLGFEGLDMAGALIDQTLSGGESEQLHMVTRLALADLVTDGERQLVILDDSLGATDPRRFARFLAIVQELAEHRMQFVIATCDKARYLGLSGATFVDLEALRRPQLATAASA